jgi:hypothetical protein
LPQQVLDPIPIWAVFLGFAMLTLICYEVGYQVGRWWQDRQPGEQEGPNDVIVGALLALMAFLLAVTMGIAGDRFDTRRGLVLDDANAINAVYLQADYLPAADAQEMKQLVREYLPLRIATSDRAQLQANLQRSVELQAQMWAIEARVAESGYLSDLMSSLGDSLTNLVNVGETRVVSAVYARVPETVLWLLLIGSALSLGMVGYSAGLKKRRSLLSAVILIVTLGVVLTLVVDLDRPQEGFITVSQQPLLDVQKVIGTP